MTATEPALLSGWGRATASRADVSHEDSTQAVADAVRAVTGSRGLLARGLGRSYGDAAQNAGGRVVRTDALVHVGTIDPTTGLVDVQAGASIQDVLTYAVPRGWFVPVTPGTRHVTLGGALAADVHGKNHHRDGSISGHVTQVDLVDGTGAIRTIGPDDAAYAAVVGGMGLAGVVTRVRLRLQPIETASLTVQTSRTGDLGETMAALEAADRRHRYTVAWVDTLARGGSLGRAVLTSGDHTPAGADAAGGAVTPLHDFSVGRVLPGPPWAPAGLLTARRMRLFNELYFRRAPSSPRVTQESITAFFHPLDAISGWNRMYGRTGFLQHQFTVADAACVRAVLELFQRAEAPGFLAVLKRFGAASPAPLSFPQPGWTLAVDLPARNGLRELLDEADELITDHGGRVYLAKDSRMRPELVPRMYPGLDRWRELRAQLDPHHVFASDLSRRLNLC